MELSEQQEKLEALGVTVATVTYDNQEAAERFTRKHGLNFPILRDSESRLIRKLGILNTGFEPGDKRYGVPHPGIFVIDNNGVIQAKLAEAGYRDRPAWQVVLSEARKLGAKAAN